MTTALLRSSASPQRIPILRPCTLRSASATMSSSSSSSSSSTSSTSSLPRKTLRLVPSPSPLTPPSFYRPEGGKPPPHWKNAHPRGFTSPWPSNGGTNGVFAVLRARLTEWEERALPRSVEEGLPAVRQCTWVEGGNGAAASADDGKLRCTWLGHAACHLQVPLPVSGTTTATTIATLNVLTDPVLSQRCSPFSFLGPKRYTRAPTSVPAMAAERSGRAWPDVVLLSHNHYDHCDYDTLRALSEGRARPPPLFVVPLGMRAWIEKYIAPARGQVQVVELDWWEERILEVDLDVGERGTGTRTRTGTGRLRIVCTPAQHFSGRGLADRDETLWASYALHVLPAPAGASPPASTAPLPRIWFSGDTGYRTAPRGCAPHSPAEAALPHCPAFAEIGALLGPFDLALIACGAYAPRSVFSSIHAAPHEAVSIHGDVRSRLSVGVHHSVFRLTAEDVDEPAREFLGEARRARVRVGFDAGEGDLAGEGDEDKGRVAIMEIGETRVIDVGRGGR